MKKGLVSIITPCYNGEEYIENYAKAILKQTYPNIELIFIDDGSTDKTAEKINSYQKAFKERNFSYCYIYQKNKGQAAALNAGLQKVTGEFLTWPDSDDILYPDSIEKRVKFLQENSQYDLVRNEVRIVDFDTKQKTGEFKLSPERQKTKIFEDLIFGKDVFYAPISYMIRTEKFLELNPERKIFETRYGQNWQMLLPISYVSECGYISETLCDYIVRENSHSRQKYKTLQEEFFKIEKHIEILQEVLLPMNLWELYKDKVYQKYNRIKLKQTYYYQDAKKAKEIMNELKKQDSLRLKDYIYYYAAKYPTLYNMIQLIKKGK